MKRLATPAASKARTACRTLWTPPNPVSASTYTGTSTAMEIRPGMVGVVAHVGLAHVGFTEQASDRRVAAGDDGLEALRHNDPSRKRVVCAWKGQQAWSCD